MKVLGKIKGIKRKVEVVVISGVHLGSAGAHAFELLDYLKSIKPQKIILNGDIINLEQLRNSYWPVSHIRVLKYLLFLLEKGIQIEYITGNHDKVLRQFALAKHDFFRVQTSLLQEVDGKKCWIFHGDVFGVKPNKSALLSAIHQVLARLSRLWTFSSHRSKDNQAGAGPTDKNRGNRADRFVHLFEQACAATAIAKGYHYVICGHTHNPEIRTLPTPAGQVTYMNSGGWVENLTSLEYYEGEWHLHHFYKGTLCGQNTENHSQESYGAQPGNNCQG